MRSNKFFFSVFLVLTACASSQKTAQLIQNADLYYYQKDYSNAFESYSKIIESYAAKKQQVPGEMYVAAGKCLYYMDSPSQAMEYFSRADDEGVTDEQMSILRIKYYGSIDNLSKEVDFLEKYSAIFPEGDDINYVNSRLFARYYEMQEYWKAYLRFPKLTDEERDKIEILEKYYNICHKLKKDDEAAKVARQLYDMNPNNLIGLEFVANESYSTTEAEYVAAIKAYESNKTTATYKVLQQKTTPLIARYKKAKELYVRLYGITKSTHHASILSRICSRLNDKKGADYYSKLASGK